MLRGNKEDNAATMRDLQRAYELAAVVAPWWGRCPVFVDVLLDRAVWLIQSSPGAAETNHLLNPIFLRFYKMLYIADGCFGFLSRCW